MPQSFDKWVVAGETLKKNEWKWMRNLYKSTFSTPMGAFGEAFGAPGVFFASRTSRSNKRNETLIFWIPPPGTNNFWLGVFGISLRAPWRPQGITNQVFLYTFLCRCENVKVMSMFLFFLGKMHVFKGPIILLFDQNDRFCFRALAASFV